MDLRNLTLGFYVGEALCDICAREWTAIYPETCERLECPSCGHMTRAPHVMDADDDAAGASDDDDAPEPWRA